MLADKPADVRRIFVFGESAAMGDPQPAYGASRYLEVLLRERFPKQKFEVINMGITAINSHVILPIAQECAQQPSDLWIIYMGNNEMVGPFGAATVFGSRAPPLWVVRINLAVQKFRVGQLAMSFLRHASTKPGENIAWGGMKMFLQNQIAPTDPRKETVYRNFETNLREIVSAGLDSGAKVVLSTMSVNLRDCPPFASWTNTNLPAADLEQFKQLFTKAQQLEQDGNHAESAHFFSQAARLDATCAELQYRWANCLLALTNAAAPEHFQLACDLDALPFRADTRINRTIRELATKFSGAQLVLCDAEKELQQASPVSVAGDESFFEHVHFSFAGNYRLALAWAERVQQMLLPTSGSAAAVAWASQEECDRRLGLADFNRAYGLQTVMRRMEQPPLSGQFNNPQRLRRLQAEENKIQERLQRPDATANARELFRAALAVSPEDHYLYEGLANLLESTGDFTGAGAAYRRSLELLPQDFYARLRLGCVLAKQAQLSEAIGLLQQAAKLRPSQAEAWSELATAQAMAGEYDAALKSFDRACELRPQDPTSKYYRLHYNGKRLAKLNRYAEAMEQYRKAIEVLPGNWEAHFEMGGELDAANQLDEAAKQFGQAAQLNPSYSRTRFNYGVLLAKQKQFAAAQREFEEAVRLEPEYAQARDYLTQIRELRASAAWTKEK